MCDILNPNMLYNVRMCGLKVLYISLFVQIDNEHIFQGFTGMVASTARCSAAFKQHVVHGLVLLCLTLSLFTAVRSGDFVLKCAEKFALYT